MLPFQARVDLGAMVMKWYSTFPKAPALLKPSPSDYLVSYPGHLFGGRRSYPSAEKQSVYSAAPADWARKDVELFHQDESMHILVLKTKEVHSHIIISGKKHWWTLEYDQTRSFQSKLSSLSVVNLIQRYRVSQYTWVCLFGWLVLWHINLYKLFNAKSIFM